LLFGLQGSGKTTTAAKLGRWLQKQGKQPLLVAADVYRPAAIDQLVTLGQQLGVPVHTLSGNTDVLDIVESAAARVRIEGQDAVIVDTAGRLQIDTQMMAELLMLERWLRTQDPAQPQEKLLVVDSMMGQEAVRVAEAFHTQLTMTGLVLTKMDGDARGGAALSVVEITGQPIKFIGVSEKPDGLEPFHPDRLASRILGMGDVVSLFEKAQEAIQLEDAQHMQSKFLQDNFSIDDFLQLQKQMSLFGSMDQILGMLPIPGLDKETREKMAHGGEQQMKRVSVMVQSMTARERAMPELLEQNPSRCLRIARGAGLPVEEVTAFVGQFMQMRQMMKQFAKLLSGDFNLFGLGDDDDDNDASPNPRMLGPGRPAGTYTNQQQLMHMRQKIEKSARKQKRKAPFIPPYHRP
jgi:signal recognition particle subunit SRP54